MPTPALAPPATPVADPSATAVGPVSDISRHWFPPGALVGEGRRE